MPVFRWFAALAIVLATGPAHAKEVWLSPAPGSADYLALFDANWNSPKAVDVFKFHDATFSNPTVYNGIVARNGFRRLQAWGMRIAYEAAVLKPVAGWCSGDILAGVAIDRVNGTVGSQGGNVTSITMDEPLNEYNGGCPNQYSGANGQPVACQNDSQCTSFPGKSDAVSGYHAPRCMTDLIDTSKRYCARTTTYNEVLEITARWMNMVHTQLPSVELIDIEAYPNRSTTVIRKFVDDLLSRGAPLKGLHVDVNREILGAVSTYQSDLANLAQYVRSRGLKFGVIFFGQRVSSNEDYVADILNYYVQTPDLRSFADHDVFQSWHPPGGVPLNIWNPKANHVGLIRSARKYFDYVQNTSGQPPLPCDQPVSDVEYLGFYPDILTSGRNPFLHYKLYGKNEHRCPLTDSAANGAQYYPCNQASGSGVTRPITPQQYLTLYDDVRNAPMDPVYHYQHFGRNEGRCPIVGY
jgi:hypothetical protein